MKKTIGKKFWILIMFSVFIAAAMSFVSWIIYAVFADNYRDIKQQYYAVVSKQVVEDIENSVKNGKSIERFYGMDSVLGEMLDLISGDTVTINTAVTDSNGNVLYSSYSDSEKSAEYAALIASDDVQNNLAFEKDGGDDYTIVTSGNYEVMIQPIYDKDGSPIGSLELFYLSEDIEAELLPQKESSNITTMICVAAVILLLVIYFAVMPRAAAEDCDSGEDEVVKIKHKHAQSVLLFVVPVSVIMAGLLVQCVISYNTYQKRYKDVMFEGAQGISEYIGGIVSGLNEKGVPYEKMEGLTEYLAEKVEDTPLLWNISVANVYADTSGSLSHTSEYNVSMAIGGDSGTNMHINVEISKEYIDEKMTDMLLVFAVTFIVALIMIFELLKLPDSILAKFSRSYKESPQAQADSVAPVLRLGAFAAYTGMYVGIPFSSVLITQWNKSIFGLSVTFLASMPLTAELLATMICSLGLLPVYKRLNLKATFIASAGISVLANLLCFTANSPEQLIIYRFISGIGFAGIKYSLNTIVSEGAVTNDNTTDNLGSLNAGLLGGITCGGTLGAVIASSISVKMSYLIAGLFIAAFIVIIVCLAPWKLVFGNIAKSRTAQKAESEKKSVRSFVLNPGLLRYIVLVAVPMNVGLMFISAFFPSYVTSAGLPDLTTSYGYLINGLVGIYIGPKLLTALSKKLGRTACVFIALLTGAVSVLLLNINIPLVITMVSVAVLGLFDGFGTPATSDYYVNMPAVKRFGVSQGLSVLNVVGSAVQTFSPVLYSAILAGGLFGLNVLGLSFAACAVLFLLTIKLGGKDNSNSPVSEMNNAT